MNDYIENDGVYLSYEENKIMPCNPCNSETYSFTENELKRIKDMSYRLMYYSGSQYFKAIFIKASELLLEISKTEDEEIMLIEIMRWKKWVKNLNIDIVNFLCIVADEEDLCQKLFFN